jgi:hypothetical protein
VGPCIYAAGFSPPKVQPFAFICLLFIIAKIATTKKQVSTWTPNTREQNDVKHERTKIDNSIPVLGRYNSLVPKQLGNAGSNIAMVCGWEEMNHQN